MAPGAIGKMRNDRQVASATVQLYADIIRELRQCGAARGALALRASIGGWHANRSLALRMGAINVGGGDVGDAAVRLT